MDLAQKGFAFCGVPGGGVAVYAPKGADVLAPGTQGTLTNAKGELRDVTLGRVMGELDTQYSGAVIIYAAVARKRK